MTSTAVHPGLLIGGGSAPINGTIGELSQLDVIYQNLISGGAQTFTSTGSRTLVIDSGAIGTASVVQVGSYPSYGSEATETAAQVSANFETLKRIAVYCRANSISVQVDAGLNNGTTYNDGTNALVDQWAPVAAAAGLPIVSVEDVNEQGIVSGTTAAMFANQASIEVSAIQTLIKAYASSSYHLTASNLTVGDMEAGGVASVSEISQWWSAYNTAAHNAGVNSFSFVSAEMGWDAPWLSIQSGSSWQQYINAISELANSENMALNVIVQGMQTDITGSMFVSQQEQHAAQLALFTASNSISVDNILLRTWQPFPVGASLITAPNSMSNSATEITATYPLYQAGSITVQGCISVSVPNQAIVTTGLNTSLTALSVQWAQADVYADRKLAVVVIDQTGTLNATQYEDGTVSKLSSNILILNGNSAEISAEISSITLNEPNSGPDTIDVESFGLLGQLSDNHISVLALTNGQQSGLIDATSNQQGWVSSSAILNTGTVVSAGSMLTSETLYWSTSGKLAGSLQEALAFVKIDSVHLPLAEYGVKELSIVENGTTINALVDSFNASVDNPYLAPGGYANNAGNNLQAANDITWQENTFKVNPFDPAGEVTSFAVTSTINTFDPNSGVLQQSLDILAPNPLSIVNFYGSAVANVFSTDFDLGGTQIIEYNTGSNPAWQQAWGIDFKSATLTYDHSGQLVEKFLQGGSNQPSYSIDTVYNPANGQIWEQFQTAPPPEGYSGLATGPLYITQFNTGDNPNWDYLDWGSAVTADTEVVSTYLITNNFVGVAFAGVDQIVTFSTGTVYGADNASANMYGSNDIICIGVNDILHLSGNHNTITGAVNETITQNGTGYIDTLGVGSVINNTATNASFAVNGSGIKVTAAAGNTITDSGTTNSFTFLNGGTFSESGVRTSDIVIGNGVTGWLNVAGETIQVTGNSNVITSNINDNIAVLGDHNTIGAGSGSTISLNGSLEVVYGSNLLINLGTNTTATINSNGGSTVIGGTNIAVTASHEAVFTRSGSSFSLIGSNDTVDLVTNSKALLGGFNEVGFITGSTGHNSIIANSESQTVSGFKMANGDRLDLSQILAGAAASGPTLSSYVKIAWSGLDTILAITGPRGSDSVTLSHVGAVSLQSLISNNAFVLPTQDLPLHENSVPWIPDASRDQKRTSRFETPVESREAEQHQRDLAAHFSRIQVHLRESPNSLTDHEMLEMFLHIILSNQDTRSLARALLAKYGTLGATIAAPANELEAIDGLGRTGATALKLLHAATVNILRKEVEVSTVLECWDQLIDYLSVSLKHERVECFHVLFLDNRGALIADEVQTNGTISQVSVYPREIVRRCLELHASALIMVHNHPSGDPQPSPQDVTITLAVQRAAAIMGIALHDHIIVGRFGYRSFRQEKLM